MSKPQNRPRLSDRAYELAARLDPGGNRARSIELALEVLALIEWRDEANRPRLDPGEQTRDAMQVLKAYEADRRDYALVRLAQGLELFAMASASKWPDGSTGLRGLAEWLGKLDPEESTGARRWDQLASGDVLLSVLRRVHAGGDE